MLLRALKKNSILRFFSELPGISRVYHFTLAFLGALWYGFPSRKLIVIGVTGTKGKTTTCNLIAHLLNAAGHKAGMATTVNFRIGEREWVNDTKQTMPGRFALQKLLRDMASAGCEYAVIETSSEGILQYRHRFIHYRVAVFTSLSPEHIERHGSFERYRATKKKLFEQVARNPNSIGVYNLDDPNVAFFLKPAMSLQYGYAWRMKPEDSPRPVLREVRIENVKFLGSTTQFTLGGTTYEMPLIGEFNVYNAASALLTGLSQDIDEGVLKMALQSAPPVPGRFEVIKDRRGFSVVIDYAHEPASLEAIYGAVRQLLKPARIIVLLGSQGGGRDVWKREAMGKLAGRYGDEIILTNEDPYDEDPNSIIDDILKGVSLVTPQKNVYKIIDRREAIKKAISLARKGDTVVVTGKGGEVWMCLKDDKKIPWSDRKIAEEYMDMKI